MIAQSVAEIVSQHVRLSVEGIDRMYLNVFVPGSNMNMGLFAFFAIIAGCRCRLPP